LNGFLLDTNILSALRRPADNRSLIEFIEVQPRESLFTTSVTLAEIRAGIELKQDPLVRTDLGDWLEHVIRPLFTGRVLDVDEDALLRWLLITREGRARGHSYTLQDSLIAGIALVHQLIAVTRDETHFVAAGVPTLDPWTSTFHADGATHKVPSLVSATLVSDLSIY
jgi:predicted nucleic acid-binding protein